MGDTTITLIVIAVIIIGIIIFIVYFSTLCPDGGYYNMLDGNCYKCPDGYQKSPTSLFGDTSCSQHMYGPAIEIGKLSFDRVESVGRNTRTANIIENKTCKQEFGKDGRLAFFDPRGECWSCDPGFRRNGHPVTHDKACEKPIYNDWDPFKIIPKDVIYRKARLDAKDRLCCDGRKKCPEGTHRDPNGNCYTCPLPTERTLESVMGPNACSAPCPVLYKGSFDHWGGRDCYKCKDGFFRTAHSINSNKACQMSSCSVIEPGSFGIIGTDNCYKCDRGLQPTFLGNYKAGDYCQGKIIRSAELL